MDPCDHVTRLNWEPLTLPAKKELPPFSSTRHRRKNKRGGWLTGLQRERERKTYFLSRSQRYIEENEARVCVRANTHIFTFWRMNSDVIVTTGRGYCDAITCKCSIIRDCGSKSRYRGWLATSWRGSLDGSRRPWANKSYPEVVRPDLDAIRAGRNRRWSFSLFFFLPTSILCVFRDRTRRRRPWCRHTAQVKRQGRGSPPPPLSPSLASAADLLRLWNQSHGRASKVLRALRVQKDI